VSPCSISGASRGFDHYRGSGNGSGHKRGHIYAALESVISPNALEKLASRRGLEPLTPGLGNLCSIQLSYRDSDQPCTGQNPYGQGRPKRGMPLA
jgi:hypothetical protein